MILSRRAREAQYATQYRAARALLDRLRAYETGIVLPAYPARSADVELLIQTAFQLELGPDGFHEVSYRWNTTVCPMTFNPIRNLVVMIKSGTRIVAHQRYAFTTDDTL